MLPFENFVEGTLLRLHAGCWKWHRRNCFVSRLFRFFVFVFFTELPSRLSGCCVSVLCVCKHFFLGWFHCTMHVSSDSMLLKVYHDANHQLSVNACPTIFFFFRLLGLIKSSRLKNISGTKLLAQMCRCWLCELLPSSCSFFFSNLRPTFLRAAFAKPFGVGHN